MRYTFGTSRYAVHHEWLRYVIANLLCWAANNGVYVWIVFHSPVAYQHLSVAVGAGSVAGMFLNFGASRVAVFQKN